MAKRTRPIKGVQRRYPWRLYPTPEQETELWRQARLCAQLWNALLEMWETIERRYVQRQGRGRSYHSGMWLSCAAGPAVFDSLPSADGRLRTGLNFSELYDVGYWITSMLRECDEWAKVSTWVPRRVATSFCAALNGFLSGRLGRPQYKAAARAHQIPHRCKSGCRVRPAKGKGKRDWEMYMMGVGWVAARGRLPAVMKPEPGRVSAEVSEWTDADVGFIDNHWRFSVATDIAPRRRSIGDRHVTIRFGQFDCLAMVDNIPFSPPGFAELWEQQKKIDELQADFDKRWPRRRRTPLEERAEKLDARERLTRLWGELRRKRNDILHVWTRNLVMVAARLTIHKAKIQENTESPHGDKYEWGAETEFVSSKINRPALFYAPAMATNMLIYKAKESGIPVEVIEDSQPDIVSGRKLVTAGKARRKLKRALKG